MPLEITQKTHIRDIFSTSPPPIQFLMKERATLSPEEAIEIIQDLEKKIEQQSSELSKLKSANNGLNNKLNLSISNLHIQEQLVIQSGEKQKILQNIIPAISKQFEENLKLESDKTEQLNLQLESETKKSKDLRRQLGLTSKKIEKLKGKQATETATKTEVIEKLESSLSTYKDAVTELQDKQKELKNSISLEQEMSKKLANINEQLKKSYQSVVQQKKELEKSLNEQFKLREQKLQERIENLTKKNTDLTTQVSQLSAVQETKKTVIEEKLISQLPKKTSELVKPDLLQQTQKTQNFFIKHQTTILSVICTIGLYTLSHALLKAKELSNQATALITTTALLGTLSFSKLMQK